MRTAILLQPPVRATEALPDCFADPVDEAALREWIAHPRAPSRLVAVPPGLRFDDVVPLALGVAAEPDDSVLVVYVAAHAVLAEPDAATLGLDAAIEESAGAASTRIDDLVLAAARDFEDGDWESARSSYTEIDERLGNEVSTRHAEVLVALGDIERLQGRTTEAIALLDRALSMSPHHLEALKARASIARTTNDHAIAAAMLHRIAGAAESPAERAEILHTIATASLEAARDATMRALEIEPGNVALLQKRRAIAELAENWADAVSVEVQLAERIADPSARARALVAAADRCRDKARDRRRAVALYEAAIEDDPRVEGAFDRVEAALVEAGDWAGAARAYERQIERLRALGDDDQRVQLLTRLASVSAERLGDSGTAIRALDEVAAARPEDVEARALLARLLDEIGRPELGARCLEVAAAYAPFRAQTYRDLRRLVQQCEDDDRSYAAAAVLVALGEADLDEQLAYTQFAPESPLRPARAFDEDVWQDLSPGDHDRNADAAMAAVEPAALSAWLAARTEDAQPDERDRQDPETTTVSAVRSFLWASRILGVAQPSVYAQPSNAAIAVATIPGASAAVLLGRAVLTGRSSIELSFLAAHHMTYFRPGYRLISYFPKPGDLHRVIRASVSLARPDLAGPGGLDEETSNVARHLEPHFDDAGRRTLGDALGRLREEGRTLDVGRWARDVETVACRAALLLTGDVTVASKLLSVAGGPLAGLTARDRARDLLPFSVSERYGALRERLGVSLASPSP